MHILIAHAEGEEVLADEVGRPLATAGYDVQHHGTLFIGESIIEESSKALRAGAPVVLCGTVRAMGTAWPHRVVNAARNLNTRVFVLKMERDAYVEALSLDTVIATYWSDPAGAIEKLLESLRKYYPPPSNSVSIPSGISINAYLTGIRRQYQRVDLEGLTPSELEQYLQIQLRSVFVEQHVRDNPPPLDVPKHLLGVLHADGEIDEKDFPADVPLEEVRRVGRVYYGKESKPVLDVLTNPQFPFTVVLGDPGSGKSTLARYLILSLADAQGDPRIREPLGQRLPILIELKQYVALCAEDDECKDFLDFMRLIGKREGQYPELTQLQDHLDKHGGLFIFDGLDEIFDVAHREQVSRQIAHFPFLFPKVRIIVTSRIVGYKRRELSAAGFQHVTLQDLDRPQVKLFVEQWYSMALRDRAFEASDRCDRIMRSYDESVSLQQLAGNPMLLTIMVIIAKNQELPRERWKLYDHAAGVLIQHWDVNRHLKSRHVSSAFIDEDDKKEMLRRLAFKMQAGDGGLAGNYIHGDHLRLEIENYLRERYLAEPMKAREIATSMLQQFHERNFILSLYGGRLYGFVHRAFLEYFCATAFIHGFEKTKKISLEDLQENAFADHWDDQSWHEVLRLITGMLVPEFSGRMIAYLTEEAYPQWPSPRNLGLKPPWNIALAVQCLSEVKNLREVSEQAERLLINVCELFDYDMDNPPELFSFLGDQVVPHAVAIGPQWPHRERLADILMSRKPREHAYIYDSEFGTFIGGVGKGNDAVHAAVLHYAEHADERQRVLAPFALAVGWGEQPFTVEKLRQLATTDNHWTVRYAAIYALSEHYQQETWILELLQKQALTEEEGFSRVAAINGLANYFSHVPDVLNLLLEMIAKEQRKYPRTVLVKALGRRFAKNDKVFDLLCRLALQDESPRQDDYRRSHPFFVREAAIHALFFNRPTDPQTLTVMREVANTDPTPWMREVAADFTSKLMASSEV